MSQYKLIKETTKNNVVYYYYMDESGEIITGTTTVCLSSDDDKFHEKMKEKSLDELKRTLRPKIEVVHIIEL